MNITLAGRRYYERCLRILREVEDARTSVGDALEGPLLVTAPVSFGLVRVVPHVHALMAKHPRLRIELRLEDRVLDLALEGVDVALRVGVAPPESTDLVAHPLLSYRRTLVAAPSYLKRRGEPKSPEALAKHDTLMHMVGALDSWSLISPEREVRLQPSAAFRSNAAHAIHDLALRGAGIALLPDWFVADDLQQRRLRAVLAQWHTASVVLNASHRVEQRGATRVRTFIGYLRDVYSATAPSA